MDISLLPEDVRPAYRQISDRIAAQILSRSMPGGTPLPSIRTAAKELGVSVITVRSAWEALEADGLITTRAGSGCFVAELSDAELAQRRRSQLEPMLDRLIRMAKDMGCPPDELARMVKQRYGQRD